MTNHTAPATIAPQPTPPAGTPAAHRSGAVWILGIGAVALASQIGLRLDTRVGTGLVMCIPMAIAVVAMVRSRREQGRVSVGSLWFAFGASFPAALGIARIVGADAATVAPFIFPVGFLVIGTLMLLGRVGPGHCARSRRGTSSHRSPETEQATPSPTRPEYPTPGHVGTD